MKKYMMVMSVICSGIVLFAGGNVNPNLSGVADIPKDCSKATVYIEEDTRLMWQDAPYTDAEDGAYKRNHSVGKAGSWRHAVNYCRRLNYAGYTDWRLPTADELAHVHRKVGQVFKNARANDFWTSTPTTDVRYYVIYPADAYQYKRYKRESNYIRCVRCIGGEPRKRLNLIKDDVSGEMRSR